MRQAREFQHLLGQEKEQSSLLLRKFNATAAELSDLRWNNAELREKVKQVPKLEEDVANLKAKIENLQRDLLEKGKESTGVIHLEEQKASLLASLEKSKSTVAELQEDIRKLNEDFNSKVDENSDLTAQLEELQKTVNSAKDREVNFQSVVDKLRNQLSEKQETVDLLESQMCEKQQELDEVNHCEEQNTSLLASLEKSKLTVAELQENITKLKEDLTSKVDENSDLTTQLEELQKTINSAKDREVNFQSVVDKLKNQLSEKQETVDLLESQMCEKQQELDEVNHLEKQKTNLLDSLEKSKLTVAELQEEIIKLKEDLISKVDENSDLTAQLEELQRTVNSAKDKEVNFQSVVDKLRNQLSEKQETVDLLESQMCEKEQELDEVNHLEEQKTNLLDSLEKSKLTVAELQEEIAKLKEDLISKVDENSDLTAKLEELQKTVNSAMDKEANFQSVVDKLRNQLSEKQETVDLLESQMCEKQQELDEAKEGQVGVMQQQSDAQQQLQAMEKEKAAAANRAENLETTLESLKIQLEEKASQIHGLEEQTTALQDTIDELEAKLTEKEKRADEVFVLEEQTANLQSTVEELEAKLAEKQKEMDEVLNLEGQTTSLVDELRSQLCDKEKQIDQMSSERELLSEELREIKEVFAELQEEMQNKEDEFLDTKEKGIQHIDALNSELTEARTRLEKLSEELDATKALLEEKQTSTKQEEERSGYEKQVADLNAEIKKLNQKMEDTTNNFLEQIRHMEKCCDEADNELKQEKIEHKETKRKLEVIQAGQNEEGDASEDVDKPKGRDKALAAAKKKIQSLEKSLQEGLEHIKLLQEARDHTSQQEEIRHLQQCCMEADAELEQEKEEHEKTKQKLLQLEENIKMKKPEEKSLEELKQELGAKNMEIVQLKRDLLMEIDPLKKKLKSLKDDNDYLQNKVSEYRNELRKAREEQAEVTVSQFGSQSCKTCAQRSSGSSSGIISRVAYFTVETENKRLKEQVTGLEGQVKELTLYKSEFKKKIELLKRELSYYKGKTGIAPALDEAPKVPLKGVTNSPRASPARPAPVTTGSSPDQKSSENYNWLAGGVDWDKNDVKADEQPSECTTQ
ncbi:myosin-10 isoform X3 [Lingula anatina]|uniref:Myosin-10 isoform X3 n=1 Tax=Lingula anatina TaxID=7574 RepID=A0A2R2MTV1_LINAN|nr:myosin-10 isoform X3 [Lingula anatina]|eukprot:XP_023933553.1 myosin-10 isoform X3 [Lingula anatina]